MGKVGAVVGTFGFGFLKDTPTANAGLQVSAAFHPRNPLIALCSLTSPLLVCEKIVYNPLLSYSYAVSLLDLKSELLILLWSAEFFGSAHRCKLCWANLYLPHSRTQAFFLNCDPIALFLFCKVD